VRGCFVTGTGTGVGKTVLAAAVAAALRARGVPVVARKPVLSGLDDAFKPDWPADHELLARAAECSADEVVLARFGPPVSPHLAAELAGRPLELPAIADAIRNAAGDDGILIVEGVGGLLVPLSFEFSVRDLAADLGLPLLVAAAPGLGTISHTLLTLEAARAARLDVLAVVLTPWPAAPGQIERSNRETVARLGHVNVEVLPSIERGEPALLAAAGAQLPLDDWFELRS
jgi:dethiobiotin synthetase